MVKQISKEKKKGKKNTQHVSIYCRSQTHRVSKVIPTVARNAASKFRGRIDSCRLRLKEAGRRIVVMRSVALRVSPSFHSDFLFSLSVPPNFSLIDTHFWRGFFFLSQALGGGGPSATLSSPRSQSGVERQSRTKYRVQWTRRNPRVPKEEPLSGLEPELVRFHDAASWKKKIN